MPSDNPVSWIILTMLVMVYVVRLFHAACREIQEIHYEYYREGRKG